MTKINFEKTALTIAEMYLEKNPRNKFYKVILEPEEEVICTPYLCLTDENIKIIRECNEIAEEEGINLDKVLESKGYEDLATEAKGFQVSLDLYRIDLENPLKYSDFKVLELNEDGTLSSYKQSVPLTDAEWAELFAEHLLRRNYLSFNNLIYYKPKFAQHISSHIAHAAIDFIGDSDKPFIVEMTEFREACENVLNPFKDTLKLFDDKNESIERFVDRFKIIPGGEDWCTLYEEVDNDSILSIRAFFEGTNIEILHEIIPNTPLGVINSKKRTFTTSAKNIMKRFSIEKVEDIFPYLQKNYNFKNCFEILKKDLNIE